MERVDLELEIPELPDDSLELPEGGVHLDGVSLSIPVPTFELDDAVDDDGGDADHIDLEGTVIPSISQMEDAEIPPLHAPSLADEVDGLAGQSLPSVSIDVDVEPPADEVATGLVSNKKMSKKKRKKKRKQQELAMSMFPAAENVVIMPRRRTFGGCTEGSFSTDLPNELDGIVGTGEFEDAIQRVNSVLASSLDIWVPYAPCVMCIFPALLLIVIEEMVIGAPRWLEVILFLIWMLLAVTSVVLFIVYFMHQSKVEAVIAGIDEEFKERGVRFTQGKRRELSTLYVVIEKTSSV